MLQYAAYLYDEDQDDYHLKTEFLVHSCGRISFQDSRNLRIDRENGRKDYQIIYISRGKGHFWQKGQEKILTEGSLILYAPEERQKYSFYGKENAEFYWLHFSGSRAEELLERAELRTGYVGMAPQMKRMFEEMIRELMMKRKGYIQIGNLKGEECIWFLAREEEQWKTKDREQQEEMEKIIEKINLCYAENLSVRDLAGQYGVSVEWFIKLFSKYTGMTPKQYISEIRLNHAKELLDSADYNISEVSQACGFENPLYFSRYFKKKYHRTPSEYRKRIV